MQKSTLLFVFFTLIFSATGTAQLVWTDPAFPRLDDQVTVFFNAQEGTGGLANCNCDIYVHTGVITSQSTSPGDWKHVTTTWGTANPDWKMTPVAGKPDVFSWTITPSIKNYYGIGAGETVENLAFVFRNADGSKEGKADGGADIFYPVYPDDLDFTAAFIFPTNTSIRSIGETLSLYAATTEPATLSLFDNGDLLATETNVQSLFFDLPVTQTGLHLVELVADDGVQVARDTIYYTGNPPVQTMDPPAGMNLGANYLNDSTILLKFYAPEKDFVYVLGDFNDWAPTPDFYMNRGTDDATWWLQISGLTPGQPYAYQYWVDGKIKIADPFSELILDPQNDANIPAVTFPDLPAYPTGKTTGHASVVYPGKTAFDWQNDDFEAPEKQDLVIYELLVRDFIHRHDYPTLLDTLDYLERLGINAIELMPPGEFENNESWGYNPSYHMALDKYYGRPEDFKRLVDECHRRGIAVIVDIVLNHAFGQSPLVQLYWDAANNRPAANNPWFNAVCPHEPFCWGYDFNHESPATKDFVDRVLTFWLEEYHIDGFRFDFTKGFTNAGNVGFDATRIANLKRIADVVWAVNPDAYIILEHWADNAEEKILSNYGMMLWGNATYNYQEAAMGYISGSNFEWGLYKARGWNDPHLVSYMESHDEERMMYKIKTWGNANGNYNTKDLPTALRRVELAATFFYTQPGPKMLWQFGELGYDISIDDPCRVCNKPILWNYTQDPNRRRLYDVTAALIHLRREQPVFQTDDITWSFANAFKRMTLRSADMDAVVLGNFGVAPEEQLAGFPHAGWYYEFFTGDSLWVEHIGQKVALDAGEYRIYTTKKLSHDLTTATQNVAPEAFRATLYPNPSDGAAQLRFTLAKSEKVRIDLYHISGKWLGNVQDKTLPPGTHTLPLAPLPAGTYWVAIQSDGRRAVLKRVVF
ncbi:MAG: T9SS C-terminal target domain-containing protein [Bacteroidetes bacterium]|nr:MAG: T9SS C-terminal target domain-containing protein [Bacteroidota bacterium]